MFVSKPDARRASARLHIALALALMASGGVALADDTGAPAAPTSIADGVYSKAQARDGRKLFRTHCKSCHDRNYFGPVFAAWNGEPVGSFFAVLSSTMPESSPGSLAPEEYEAIFAYILDANGYAEGESPLQASAEGFAGLVIAPPGD